VRAMKFVWTNFR